jgi:drug/metabolite transporter (DMT)-like permease
MLVRGLRRGRDPLGLALGLTVALCIAGYTLVDQHGIRHAGEVPYLEVTQVGPAAVYAIWTVRARGAAALRRALGPAAFLTGVGMFGGYTLVLVALHRAPAASVSAVRETSVVIATVLAAVFLRERVSPERFAGAVLVAAGVALLGFS